MSVHLSKTTTLLDRDELQDSAYGGYVSFSGAPGLSVGVVWLERQVWEDMGSPEEVTLTVEAGDTLNEVSA